jgi:hypothetical protein
VAIYEGNGRFIHSCGPYGVCESDFETQPHMKNNIIAIGSLK